MTQSDSTSYPDRILPLPYLPTYIARRPKTVQIKTDDVSETYKPIYAANWHKAYDHYAGKHQHFYGSPFIIPDLDSVQTIPKEYDTYWQPYFGYYDIDTTESLNRIRPLISPNHTTRTSQQWSRFLDEYSDRFKINYPLANDETCSYAQMEPGRYPCQTNDTQLPNIYSSLSSKIYPVTNPYRQLESKQKTMVAHPIWIPYGTATHRYQKCRS